MSLDLSSLRRGLVRLVFPVLVTGTAVAACSGSGSGSGFGDQPDGAGTVDAGDDGTGAADDGGNDDVLLIGDASHDVGASDGSLFNDGAPDVQNDGACLRGDAGAPLFPQRCAPATNNECDGNTDTFLRSINVNASLLNGAGGNGFDDDCDGLVDEGCSCPGNGQTKDCYLVPASQVDPGTQKPVGWCTLNSKGSLDCAGTELPKWSGTCRGAQPPYRHDVCAPGDYNCDGVDQNSDVQDCSCKVDPVHCPTMPQPEVPYPPPANIPIVDGTTWIDPQVIAQTTGWTWTVIGGDCDNVLPHPTFAIYNQPNSTAVGAKQGARATVKFDPNANPARYVVSAADKLASIQAPNYGSGAAGAKVYPAFGLSGDYLVQGEWDLQGKHYVCTQKVQVRAPGIRAELCWDTVGGTGAIGGNDIDLHFARMQGATCTGGNTHGWDTTCPVGTTYQDCYYNGSSGCRDFGAPGWGYADSAQPACIGWSSKRTAGAACTNPRLDKDNITCDTAIDDPTSFSFCGPENINLDDPADNDTFVVGVNHYYNHPVGGTGPASAASHVNIYCNGARVLSVGYNPVTGQTFPILKSTMGTDSTGDFWNVATVKAHVTGGSITSCDVATIPSRNPDPQRDGVGGTQLCVESKANASVPPWPYVNHQFVDHTAVQGVANGTNPVTAAEFCKH